VNDLRKLATLIWKDLLAEFRTRELLFSMLLFALLVVVVFSFTFEPGSRAARESAPGILWVAFIFAGVLGLHRAFSREVENGSIYGLMLAPVDRGIIFLGKMTSNVIFILIIEIFTLPLFAVLFNVPLVNVLDRLLVILLLATVGFAAVGTLFSAIAINTRTRETMLPILLLPVELPVIVAAVKATAEVLNGRDWSAIAGGLKILLAFDLLFVMVCYVTFEYVLEE
jgi:heme exporter protein B